MESKMREILSRLSQVMHFFGLYTECNLISKVIVLLDLMSCEYEGDLDELIEIKQSEGDS